MKLLERRCGLLVMVAVVVDTAVSNNVMFIMSFLPLFCCLSFIYFFTLPLLVPFIITLTACPCLDFFLLAWLDDKKEREIASHTYQHNCLDFDP